MVDVSEPDEYAAGHVGGRAATCRSASSRALPRRCRRTRPLPLVLVCATGAVRGAPLALAKKLGYEQGPSAGRRARKRGKRLTCRSRSRTARQPAFHEAGQDVHHPVCPYCMRAKQLLKQRGVRPSKRCASTLQPAQREKMMEHHRPAHGAADLHRRHARRRLRRPDGAGPPRRPGAAARAA